MFVHMIDWCNESIYWISFKIQTSPLPLHNKTYHLKLTHTFVILCKAWGLNITTKTSIVTSISMKHTTCWFEWQTSYGTMTRILEPWIWFNPAKKDISSIKNHEYIYYFDMIFTRDKPVLSPCNTKVDDPNPFIWQKMNPFKADEPLSSIFMIDTPPLQIYGR